MIFEAARRIALSLPDVEEGTAWGLPVFKTGGNMFLCFRRDLDSILIRASFEQRDAMIEEDPETYYTTDHHRPGTWVLARARRLQDGVLPGLVRMGWHYASQMKKKPRAKRQR